MKKPLLSVCLLTYNQAAFVREAIDTILAQETSFEWQLVIADDCSTDGTKEVLEEYKRSNPDRLHLILRKHNVGPEENWLDLIAYAKTRYVLYAEGDDYFTDTTKLQRQVTYLETHTDASMCFHPVTVVYDDASRPNEVFPAPDARFGKHTLGMNDLLKSNFIQTNSVMYRWRFTKESVKDIWPRGIIPGDWFLHLLHAQTGKIGFIDRVMAVYRRHTGGIWWQASQDVNEIWKRYGVAHLGLYNEMSKLCGTSVQRHIVEEHIDDLIPRLIRLSATEKADCFMKAMTVFPDVTEACMQRIVLALDKTQAAYTVKEQEVRELRLLVDERGRELELARSELQAIRASRIWKTRNSIAKRIGRPEA